MKISRKLQWKIATMVVGVCAMLLGAIINHQANTAGLVRVTSLDIGQGDATLIQTPYDQTILIDGGPSSKVVSQLGAVLPFYATTIDMMILTHPHADHVAGLIDVLKKYEVKAVLYTGVTHTAPEYMAFLTELRDQGIPMEIIDHPKQIIMGDGLTLDILFPVTSFSGETVDNLNNTSIITRLVYKDISFLFTGDLEMEGEQELMATGQPIESTVLKVAHHGSRTATSDAFLDAVRPSYAVISVGEGNDFGHPHARVLQALRDRGVIILRTDEQGAVQFSTNGADVWYAGAK